MNRRLAARRNRVAAAQSFAVRSRAEASSSWSRRRFLYIAIGIFAIEATLLFTLGNRPRDAIHAPLSPTLLTLAIREREAADQDSVEGNDPALLALPSAQGFSGGAWLTFDWLQHRLTNWQDSPRWLELDSRRLGQAFQAFIGTNQRPPLLVADRAGFRPNAYAMELPVEIYPLDSTLRVEGDLVSRPLLTPRSLRSWPHTELLSNSVVQVSVNAAGQVLTASLREGSGSNEADEFARQYAETSRFAPLSHPLAPRESDRRLTWGRFVFHWRTLPTGTNGSDVVP